MNDNKTQIPTNFPDFNFKLVVIEEVMMQDSELKNTIMAIVDSNYNEDDEWTYKPIPAVLSYLKDLTLSKEQLASVKEVCLDGGNEIYRALIPYWDGEDEQFDVTSFVGFEILPNLKTITIISMCEFDDIPNEEIEALEEADISIEE